MAGCNEEDITIILFEDLLWIGILFDALVMGLTLSKGSSGVAYTLHMMICQAFTA
jgi:hypothetical protein